MHVADRQVALTREWPTWALIAIAYGGWAAGLFVLPALSLTAAVVVLTLTAVLHSSLTHEAIHGHPTRIGWLNAVLMALPLTVYVPYLRFRDTHLAHHHDERLTDPYDDPETHFLDPAVWAALPRWRQTVLRFNNTLVGRMTIGPALGITGFVAGDMRLIRRGDTAVLVAWLWHIPGLLALAWIVAQADVPFWAWALSVYLAVSMLKIRTYLEHRAHDRASGRTAVVEDRGPLALLFLNNNLHVVHHMHPRVAWYDLPALYAARRDHYLRRNDGYRYRSYAEVFRRYFLRAKDPVPHPLWRSSDRS